MSSIPTKSGITRVLLAGVLLCLSLIVGSAAPIVVAPPGLNPLNQTAVPEPPQLAQFVKNKAAAIRLGKAFFWDMQVGSDGIVACATCHFSAGADKRLKNTLNPGTRGDDTAFGNNSLGVPGFPQFGPNYQLDPVNDFPFHRRQGSPHLQSSPVVQDTNDVVGSQGVRRSVFRAVVPGSAVDDVTPLPDPVFNVGGTNTRRVTARNAPTVINAIFNFTNFWDGRANFWFNGENPFGRADPSAGVWYAGAAALEKRRIDIEFASLASQATGPPMDATEMSAEGRTFPHLGRKMLSLVPLGKQLVHPNDGVLGSFSRATIQPDGKVQDVKGLNITYTRMIQDAFQDNLWSSPWTTPDGFTQMEANFSLFWGLAIQLYEATLVSDQTPFDRWLSGDAAALTEQQQRGFALFDGIGNCSLCHVGIETTEASVASIAFISNFDNATIELMPTGEGYQAIYDIGHVNTAVRPTTEDLGRGGTMPFTNPLDNNAPFPLSFSALGVLDRLNLLPFTTPILPLFIPAEMPINTPGTFKIPTLRNVELTGPYFHNGSVMTLDDVMDFYARGGNFPAANLHDLDPIIGNGLPLFQGQQEMHNAVVAFLKALTDERVRNESAPFDHPEILIPEGEPEAMTRIPARGADGAPATSVLSLDAVQTPTRQAAQTITGTVEAGLTPEVSVNTSAVVGTVTVNGTTWSAPITALASGNNTITVSVVDGTGVRTVLRGTVFLDTTPLPPQDVIKVTRVSYRARTKTWTILGKTSAKSTKLVTSTLTLRTGPSFSGPEIGTVKVNRAGGFTHTFRKSAVAPDATNTISILSSNGTLVPSIPVKILR